MSLYYCETHGDDCDATGPACILRSHGIEQPLPETRDYKAELTAAQQRIVELELERASLSDVNDELQALESRKHAENAVENALVDAVLVSRYQHGPWEAEKEGKE